MSLTIFEEGKELNKFHFPIFNLRQNWKEQGNNNQPWHQNLPSLEIFGK